MTPEQTSAIVAARIPALYHSRKLSEFRGGVHIANYINGEVFREDRRTGRGVMIVGDGEQRVALLPLMARAAVLKKDSVLYLDLATLIDAVCEDDHPVHDIAYSVRALYVQDLVQPGDNPMTRIEQRRIESFLNKRIEGELRNYFTGHVTLPEADWWTENFKAIQHQQLRTVSLV